MENQPEGGRKTRRRRRRRGRGHKGRQPEQQQEQEEQQAAKEPAGKLWIFDWSSVAGKLLPGVSWVTAQLVLLMLAFFTSSWTCH
jgi:hypothetical protein